MSVPHTPTSPTTHAEAPANRWRRRAGRAGRPAMAVLARGEPTVWLTAGALAIAIAMIVGLIALVLFMGGRTFWPARLVRMDLRDGRGVLGEVIDRETYVLTRDKVPTLPETERSAAEHLLGDLSSIEVGRTLLRTDNKQLTGESFVWVDDWSRQPEGTSYPDWAMVLERTTWGRFIGIPSHFVVNQKRPPSGTEEQLERLIAFFEQHAASAASAEQEAVANALEQLRAAQAKARLVKTAAFLEAFPRSKSAQAVAVLETGEELPLADVTSDQPIALIRQTWSGAEESWKQFQSRHSEVQKRVEAIHDLDRDGLARLSDRQESARMDVVRAELEVGAPMTSQAIRLSELDAELQKLRDESESLHQFLDEIGRRFGRDTAVYTFARRILSATDGVAIEQRRVLESEIASLEEMVPPAGRNAIATYRAVASEVAEQMGVIAAEMSALQSENEQFVWRIVTAEGVEQEIPLSEIVRAFPANRLSFWGRVQVYFSRWAEFLFSEPREANTEGGVFPAIWGTVAMTLIMTVAAVPFGVLAALFLREYAKAGFVVSAVRIAVNNLAGVPSIVFGVFGLGFFCYLVGANIDELFYPAYVAENKPVFGTGGLLWASLTLALLTLPVVIVATEEALSAVPNSLREGSYACGASKWQTIRRIILPRALPGIMTGLILAMARGAGEVAPLMLVGAVKIAPELPIDKDAPFLHPSRSFMHLGFHIYDLGFQSPDSEAAKPMVFTTTLLLIGIVAVLNVTAIWFRSRLRRRFAASQF